jgi:single-stranded DNA-specific DHH superfamily exonuclease
LDLVSLGTIADVVPLTGENRVMVKEGLVRLNQTKRVGLKALMQSSGIKDKKITIVCISSEHNKHVIKTLQHEAFTVPTGNSRGIEYSKKAMSELLKNKYFTVEIQNADIKGGLDPIERRIQLLQAMGL